MSPRPTPITRRELLGRAVGAAASLVVSQSLLGCSAGAAAATDTGASTNTAACVLTAALTEGPYFVDEKLNRSDIRTDPTTGVVSQGVPLLLTFNVERLANGACTPLSGAYLDVWHADAGGVYSDVTGAVGERFLRGYQITDADGIARFTTIYPGWYTGRAVHIHFKLRLFTGATETYEFTSQFFFDEARTSAVHALSPYSSRGTRDTVNTSDGIYNSLTAAQKAALTLQATPSGDGYAGAINLRVSIG